MAKGVYSKAWKDLLKEAQNEIGASFFLEDATILNIIIVNKKIMTAEINDK